MTTQERICLNPALRQILARTDFPVNEVGELNDVQLRGLLEIFNQPIPLLKEKIAAAQTEKKLYVVKAKEVNTEINVAELASRLEGLLDLFKDVASQRTYERLMDIISRALNLKIVQSHGSNSDWDIYLVRTENGLTKIALFRIEADRFNNEWDFYVFKWGKNVIRIDFLGYHFRLFSPDEAH